MADKHVGLLDIICFFQEQPELAPVHLPAELLNPEV